MSAAAFIDPICFQLPDGRCLQNFLYAKPALAPASLYHFLQRHLIADEPTTQACLRSCFWWAQFWLHPSEISCDAVVELSAHDSVTAAVSVDRYLRSWQRQARDSVRNAQGRAPRCLEVRMRETWAHGVSPLLWHPSRRIHVLAARPHH